MHLRFVAVLLLAALAIPSQARGVRFHCLLTGASNLEACCCTGSTTEACGSAKTSCGS